PCHHPASGAQSGAGRRRGRGAIFERGRSTGGERGDDDVRGLAVFDGHLDDERFIPRSAGFNAVGARISGQRRPPDRAGNDLAVFLDLKAFRGALVDLQGDVPERGLELCSFVLRVLFALGLTGGAGAAGRVDPGSPGGGELVRLLITVGQVQQGPGAGVEPLTFREFGTGFG